MNAFVNSVPERERMSRGFVNVWFPQPTVLLFLFDLIFFFFLMPIPTPPPRAAPPLQSHRVSGGASLVGLPAAPSPPRFLSSSVRSQKAAIFVFVRVQFSFYFITCVTCLLLLTADTAKWVATKNNYFWSIRSELCYTTGKFLLPGILACQLLFRLFYQNSSSSSSCR